MSGCSKYSERLAAFATGEGGPDDDLTRHLPSCAACRTDLEEIRVLLRGVAETADRPARDEKFWTDFTRDVRVAVDDGAARRKRRWRLGFVLAPILAGAAAVALLVATGGRSTSLAVTVPALPDAAANVPAPAPSDSALEPGEDVEDLDGEELVDVLAALDEEPGDDDPRNDALELDTDAPNPIDEVEDMDAHQIRRLAAML